MVDKDSQSISLAASDLDWDIIKTDAKRYGFNTVSAYTQKLYMDSHINLNNRRRVWLLKFALFLDTLLLIIVLLLLIVRF